MKKLAVAIFLLIAVQSYGQFSVGLKAGVSLADYSIKTKYDKANKGGLATGLVVMNTIGKNFGVQADFLYVQKGYNIQICNQCYDKFTTTFVEVPLTLRYSFYLPKISSKLDNFKAHAVGGVYFSRWLGGKYETKIFDTKTTEDYVFTGENRADFGPNFGAGIEYALFSGSLNFDFRYSLGVVDMSAPGSTNALKNKSMIFSLSYMKSF